MLIDQITSIVIDHSIKIHSRLGPGCFEKVYEEILCYELERSGLFVDRQKILPIVYEDLQIENAYRIDLLVNNVLIIELKAQDPLSPVSFTQLKTYLALSGIANGLLLNFKTTLMKYGIHRCFNIQGKIQ